MDCQKNIPPLLLQLIFVLFFLITSSTISCFAREIHQVQSKKKLLILTSKGGYGHMAATDTLESILSPNYNIQSVKPLEEILHSVDFVKKISGRRLDSEQFYNLVLQKGWTNFLNFSCRYVSPHLIAMNNRSMERLFTSYFQKTKPDLVISVMPIINLPASNAAHTCKIPYLMITLDYDLTMWKLGMKKAKHKNIVITAADYYTQKTYLSSGFSANTKNFHPIGVPIRKTFFEPKDAHAIRKDWNIPDDKPVVMLLMGGAGSGQSYSYFKRLSQFPKPLHILVCTGRNTRVAEKISRFARKPWVSYTNVPFTLKISDLMSVSQLLITKPGPGTVTEAMVMKVPVLLDRTATPIFWERKVFDFAKRHGIGTEIRSLSKLNELVDQMLFDKANHTRIKKAFAITPAYCFDEKIKKIVEQLCSNTAAQKRSWKRSVEKK